MSIFDKVKGSISNLGNETIGKVDEVKLKAEKTPKNKEKNKKEKKESKINLNQLFKTPKKEEKPVYIQVEEITSPEVVSFGSVANTSTKLNFKNSPMLEALNTSANVDWHGTNSLEEFENVEFSMVAPVGIDASEVERFADKCVSEIKTLRRIIEKRQQDFLKLLQEAESLQNKIIEKNHS